MNLVYFNICKININAILAIFMHVFLTIFNSSTVISIQVPRHASIASYRDQALVSFH